MRCCDGGYGSSFSALQRAEIAEIARGWRVRHLCARVSVLFNEPKLLKCIPVFSFSAATVSFSALQRAEIAEMEALKALQATFGRFSALQRAEIAEITGGTTRRSAASPFQCSSTSRNC